MSTTTSDNTTTAPALCAEGIRISTLAGQEILHGVGFELHPGRILALVGESGSGKTTAGLACMGHFRQGLELTGGSVRLGPGAVEGAEAGTRAALSAGTGDGNILDLPEHQRRQLRGGTVSYVPQDPALSLNPAMRIGEQILETLQVHRFGASGRERSERVAEVLAEVGLANDAAYQRRYPHQLSGGQQQRVGIAMAFACRPAVMVLDEPTTGLDVTTQALVLATIDELAERHQVAGLYITHDLAVVSKVADEVVVMLSGDVVEHGPTAQVLYDPQHRYTRKLLNAVPDLAGKRRVGEVGAITSEQPLVIPGPHAPGEARENTLPGMGVDAGAAVPSVGAGDSVPAALPDPAVHLSMSEAGPATGTQDAQGAHGAHAAQGANGTDVLTVSGLALSYGENRVLDGIDFALAEGESMMLLGESGSGKTTLSRCVAGLNDSFEGTIAFRGKPLAAGTRSRSGAERLSIQYVFQSPFSSLNPRRTIFESVEVPLRMSGGMGRRERRAKVLEALDQVRLGERYMDRRPGDLSGGERQRAAIARALVNAPAVLVCDEVTSALDVSVQASILDLLRTLQLDTGMSMLFVTHNIALARHISQRLAVLQRGRIVDLGSTEEVLENPQHAYTQELLANVPTF